MGIKKVGKGIVVEGRGKGGAVVGVDVEGMFVADELLVIAGVWEG